jgi:hypothetical protein
VKRRPNRSARKRGTISGFPSRNHPMKPKTPALLSGACVLLLAYGALMTFQVINLGLRVGKLEKQLTHVFDPKAEQIVSR